MKGDEIKGYLTLLQLDAVLMGSAVHHGAFLYPII